MILQVLPLILFTTLSGAAAGLYVVYAAGPAGIAKTKPTAKTIWLLPVVCFVLLAVGLLFTLLHLGQPARFINGLHNPASMISQESYWAIAFALLLIIDCAFSWFKQTEVRPLRWIGAIAAVGLMVVTSLAYYKSLGIIGWHTAATIPFFILGDLAFGCALCLLFVKDDVVSRALQTALIALSAAWLVSIAAYGVALGSAGLAGTGAMVVGGIVGPLASICIAAAGLNNKLDAGKVALWTSVMAGVGLVICRYAFFAIGV